MPTATTVEPKAAFNQVRDDISQTGRDVAQAARTTIATGRDYASDAVTAVRHRAADSVEDLQLRIMDRPVTSVAIALGIGVVAGALLRRL